MNECKECHWPLVACKHIDGQLEGFVAYHANMLDYPWFAITIDPETTYPRGDHFSTKEEALAFFYEH